MPARGQRDQREQGAQERRVQRVVYVDGLVARGEDADPGRPLQQRRRRLLAREDRHQKLHFGLETVCAFTIRSYKSHSICVRCAASTRRASRRCKCARCSDHDGKLLPSMVCLQGLSGCRTHANLIDSTDTLPVKQT